MKDLDRCFLIVIRLEMGGCVNLENVPMSDETCFRSSRFGFIVTLLLVACSSPPASNLDVPAESTEFDAVTDTKDAAVEAEGFDSSGVDADSFQDSADGDDLIADVIPDTPDVILDAPSDVLVCGDVPREGCPCDQVNDKPCCLMVAKGLSCDNDHLVNGVYEYQWGVFWDCGCDGGPDCEGYDLYPLCPWQSREEYL